MRYWLGVVSREHVLRGVAGGFCQLCHGKAAPLQRMQPGDWLLYYSPTQRLGEAQKYQAFTAVGQITGAHAYRFPMAEDFIPWRRDVDYLAIRRECPIAIARQHAEWPTYARQLRYGHVEISADFAQFVLVHWYRCWTMQLPVTCLFGQSNDRYPSHHSLSWRAPACGRERAQRCASGFAAAWRAGAEG